MFEAAIYRQRRAALRARLGGGLVLLPGNDDSPMNYADNVYPFRQDSSFRYFFGIDQPGLAGLIDLDAGDDSLFGSEPGLHDIVWTGPLPSLAERAAAAGIEHTGTPAALAQRLGEAVRGGRCVHFLPPYRADTLLKLAAWLDTTPAALVTRHSTALVDAVIALRERKAPEEIGEIEAALGVTAQMHRAAMAHTRAGVLEHAVVGRMEGIVRAHDLQLAYPVIFSHRGEVLHNHDHSHCLQEGDWVVNDAGACSAGGYAADITRTLPAGGRFTPLQAELYDIVLAAQQAVIGALAPGVPFLEMHRLAARMLVEGLRAHGLFRGDPEEVVGSGAYAAVFQCGLGHQLGLDVHDMEALGEDRVGYGGEFERSSLFGLRSLRLARRLQPGFVLTVEPGLYFIPAQFGQWRAERRFAGLIEYSAWERLLGTGGVRIEDDVLVTDTAARVLGTPIPRTRAEVEAAMGCAAA